MIIVRISAIKVMIIYLSRVKLWVWTTRKS
jgi:hypothetical protein